jgi:hypothetical protein
MSSFIPAIPHYQHIPSAVIACFCPLIGAHLPSAQPQLASRGGLTHAPEATAAVTCSCCALPPVLSMKLTSTPFCTHFMFQPFPGSPVCTDQLAHKFRSKSQRQLSAIHRTTYKYAEPIGQPIKRPTAQTGVQTAGHVTASPK